MPNESNIDSIPVADAPVAAIVSKAEKSVAAPVVKAAAKAAPRAAKRVAAKRRARKAPVAVAAKPKKIKRAAKTVRRAKAAAKPAVTTIERNFPMTYDFNQLFAGFQIPGADRFQSLFADAGSKGQEFATKGQKAAEELTELTKANVEALVEAGRIAASGVKAIGQDAIASSRQGLELASQNVKSLSQAGSPTEFVQLQSELARASFDRFVAETSKLTEQVVKLAGEAIQPISNRASVNAERINELMA